MSIRFVRVLLLVIIALGSFAYVSFFISSVSHRNFDEETNGMENFAVFKKVPVVSSSNGGSKSETTTPLLPFPVMVVGYPKSGTTSVWKFFNCSGIKSQHFCCCSDVSDHAPCKGRTMAVCILNNMQMKRPILEGCGGDDDDYYQVYAQLDGERPIYPAGQGKNGVLLNNGTLELHSTASVHARSALMRYFLPQHFHLQELHEYAPNATYILPLREPLQWANSVFNWFHMRGRIVNEYVAYNSSIERPGKANALAFLARIYQEHTEFVRTFVQNHPSHALVEINITSKQAGKTLAKAFGLKEGCWGQLNRIGNRSNAKKARKKTNKI